MSEPAQFEVTRRFARFLAIARAAAASLAA